MFDSLASTPGGQPFISEEGSGRMRRESDSLSARRQGRQGRRRARSSAAFFRPKSARKGARSPGHRKPPPHLKQLIQEVRVNKPEINEGKIKVKKSDQREIPSYFQRRDEQFGTVALQLLPVPARKHAQSRSAPHRQPEQKGGYQQPGRTSARSRTSTGSSVRCWSIRT